MFLYLVIVIRVLFKLTQLATYFFPYKFMYSICVHYVYAIFFVWQLDWDYLGLANSNDVHGPRMDGIMAVTVTILVNIVARSRMHHIASALQDEVVWLLYLKRYTCIQDVLYFSLLFYFYLILYIPFFLYICLAGFIFIEYKICYSLAE